MSSYEEREAKKLQIEYEQAQAAHARATADIAEARAKLNPVHGAMLAIGDALSAGAATIIGNAAVIHLIWAIAVCFCTYVVAVLRT